MEVRMNEFDRIRDAIWGTPGFKLRRSTLVAKGWSLLPTNSYIVETVKNDEGWAVFLQAVGAEGSLRLVLPGRVMEAIFRHQDRIVKQARKERSKRGAESRKAKEEARRAKSIQEVGEP